MVERRTRRGPGAHTGVGRTPRHRPTAPPAPPPHRRPHRHQPHRPPAPPPRPLPLRPLPRPLRAPRTTPRGPAAHHRGPRSVENGGRPAAPDRPRPPAPQPARPKPRAARPKPTEPPTDLARVARALDEGRKLAERQNRPDLGNHLEQARKRLGEQVLERRRRRGVQAGQEHARQRPAADRRLPHRRRHRHRRAHRRPLRPRALGRGPPRAGGAARRRRPRGRRRRGARRRRPARRPRLRGRRRELAAAAALGRGPPPPPPAARPGWRLVDTPGVGGLESAHGIVTLGALRATFGVIFVTDASQELTGPEVAFLRQALERCPAAVCVVTKTDLYPAWRRIVELDRRHLANAGIDLPVIPVSSFLRLRAWRSPALNEESGFAPLFDWLRSGVLENAATLAVAAANRDLGFVQEQLRLEVAAEQQVLAKPEASDEVVGALRRRSERTRKLVERGNGWQQFLFDGIDQLIADVKHDLAGAHADGRARRRGRHRAGRPQGHLAGHRGVAATPGGARREREPRAAQRAGRAARGGRRRDVRAGVRGAAQAGADGAGRRPAAAHVRPGPARRAGQPEAGPHAVRRPGRAHPGDPRGLRGERRRRPAPAGRGSTRRRDRGGLHRPQADPRRAASPADATAASRRRSPAGATSTRPTS